MEERKELRELFVLGSEHLGTWWAKRTKSFIFGT